MLVKKQETKTKEEEKWVIRVYTDDSRYRIELNPSDFYYEIVKFVSNALFRYASIHTATRKSSRSTPPTVEN